MAETADITENRVKNAKSARTIYTTYFKANEKRAEAMVRARNQIDGARPMDQAQLEKTGDGWMTNVNFRDAESAFNRTFLPYWKMVHDAPTKIASTVETASPHANAWAKMIDECFDLFLKDWGADYFFQFMLITNDFVKFGPGYAMWADEDSPRFKHARTECMMLPKKAKANVADWEICAVEGDMTISDLWAKIRNPAAAKRSKYVGWNQAMVKKAIATSMKNDAGMQGGNDWRIIQDELVCNDVSVSETHAPIEIVRMFVKGFDGKIALKVFTKSEDVPEFLFESEDFADEFKHVIGALFYDVGTAGLVHSIKGFGIKNYYFSILQNRMKSKIVDAGLLAMSFNFTQEEGEADGETPPVQNFSAINIFPRGLKQMNVYPQVGAAQSVVQMLEQNRAENNYIYRDSSKDIAETTTARQAVILANLSEEIGSATAAIYLAQVGENKFAECLRRLMKPGSTDPDAVKFMRRLKAKGFPVKKIKFEDISVATGASPGTAGAALRDMIFKELLGMIRLPGMNVRAIIEAYLANKLGTQSIRQFTLPETVDSAPGQRRLAMIENSLFGQGMEMPVDPSDAHFEHAQEHLKVLQPLIQAFKQSGKLAPEHLVALQHALPHVAKHVEFLGQDETAGDQYKQVYPLFSQISSIASGIFTKLMQEQQKQQQTQPPAQ